MWTAKTILVKKRKRQKLVKMGKKKPVVFPSTAIATSPTILLWLGRTCNEQNMKEAEEVKKGKIVSRANVMRREVLGKYYFREFLGTHPEQTPSPQAWQDQAGIPESKH